MHELNLEGGLLLSVLQIILIDILLGGDNAVVIALACRGLPERLRNKGIFWGVFGAIGLRVVLIFFALKLLALPYVKIVGALLLLWIGIKLLREEGGDDHDIHAADHLWGAIRTIVVADAVMSLDNVIAVAAAAKGDIGLVAFGIAISVPIIVWGSKLVLKLMDRFPWVITAGAGLLGWIAGGMLLHDVALQPMLAGMAQWWTYVAGALGAALVVSAGVFSRREA